VSAPAHLTLALRLVVILDAAAAQGRDLAHLARAAAAGGATMLQVRGKELAAGELAHLTRRVLEAAPGIPVTVNDRLDVALAAGAAGCHLGQDDFPIAEAQAVAPPGFILGGSAGSVAEVRRCMAAGAHYVGIGPVHATGNKADAGDAIGAEGFARVHRAAPGLPALGIGGVSTDDVPALLAAGAVGVAVIGAVLGADDPQEATRELRAAVDEGRRLTG